MSIVPVWFLSSLFFLCFLMIRELSVNTVAKELMNHKVCNFFYPSALPVFFLIVTSPSSCLTRPSFSGTAECAVPLRMCFFRRLIPELWHVSRHALTFVVWSMKN